MVTSRLWCKQSILVSSSASAETEVGLQVALSWIRYIMATVRCSSSDEDHEPPVLADLRAASEVVTVSLATRPALSQAAATGYVIEKVAEDKPAAQAGIEPGWTVKRVASTDCQGLASAAVQALLKDAALLWAYMVSCLVLPCHRGLHWAYMGRPVEVVFEKPESETLPSSDDENDILNPAQMAISTVGGSTVRADQRRGNEAALSNIDDLPVNREPEDLPAPVCEAVDRKLLNASLVQKLIQRHAIPIIGHADHWDLVAWIERVLRVLVCGSGKTFAFVIPTIARLVLRGCPARPFFAGPTAQVLSPTRELAIQTCTEMEVLTKGMSIYGGETVKETVKRLENAPVDIVCASLVDEFSLTPGRLIQLLDETKLSLAYVQTVILDEADQMLEQRLAARTGHLTIGHYAEDKGGSCESIKQVLRWSPDDKQRIGELIADLRKYWDRSKGRVVIFSNMRITADNLAHQLKREGGWTCRHLHGKLDQEVREKVFDGFRRGEFDILVATNVASRGLDFPDVSLVVQFNLPEDIDVYTHRDAAATALDVLILVERGLIDVVGLAMAYMGPRDKKVATKLVDFLRDFALRVETLRRGL
ncbi:ATP-dependent RNA helicase DED1 [Symbiodinium microadriaticum]|uniref:RNA helicase n=1 Tax=Symbiodinium microadriaticum TaxID=2951 RepID=A0A1Q9E8H3_SYMMI|nr:ATP-dependent RNA helicase DED1 [Symbiodinium microadriaticum]